MQGAQLFRHLINDLLDQSEVSMLNVRELDLAQQFLAKPFAGYVSVEQELLLDIVPDLLAQEISSLTQLLAQASGGNGRCLAQVTDFLI